MRRGALLVGISCALVSSRLKPLYNLHALVDVPLADAQHLKIIYGMRWGALLVGISFALVSRRLKPLYNAVSHVPWYLYISRTVNSDS